VDQVIAAVRQDFLQRVLCQKDKFTRISESDLHGFDADTVSWLHIECHKINGIAKSVGLGNLGSAAAKVEILVANLKNGISDLECELPKITAAIRDLTREIQSSAKGIQPR
jgi:HPt (histidine-containing phosphotransfer) domain-containing protein